MISSVTKPCYNKRKNMWDNRVNIQQINEIPIYVQPKVNIAKNEQYNEEQAPKKPASSFYFLFLAFCACSILWDTCCRSILF